MKRTSTLVVAIAASFLTIISTNHRTSAQVPTQVTNSYAAKFICGVQSDGAITSIPDAQADE